MTQDEGKQTDAGGGAETGNPGKPLRPPRRRLVTRLRIYLMAGIIVAAPISITIYLSWQFISFVDRQVTPLIPVKYNPETYLPFSIPGLGLLVVIIGLMLIGALTAGFIGRGLVRFGESMLATMPVVRSIYSALKQIFETVFAEKSKAFREVVLIEYPRRKIWALGFATGTTKGEVQREIEDEVVNVFLPTTPNPTSGFLLFLPKSEVTFLEMTVEEGIKMVISGGVVTPPDRHPKTGDQGPGETPGPEEETPVAARAGGAD
jgi:uncharacterized membrane protein